MRPEDYGIPLDAEHWDERTVRNVKLSWADKEDEKLSVGRGLSVLLPHAQIAPQRSFLLGERGLAFCLDSNFGDPYRLDKRLPNVGEHQLHMNPQAARDLGIKDGDYVYVDANPADRPYLGATPSDPFYKVRRLMLRRTYNAPIPTMS